jgi:hypothetical protein
LALAKRFEPNKKGGVRLAFSCDTAVSLQTFATGSVRRCITPQRASGVALVKQPRSGATLVECPR